MPSFYYKINDNPVKQYYPSDSEDSFDLDFKLQTDKGAFFLRESAITVSFKGDVAREIYFLKKTDVIRIELYKDDESLYFKGLFYRVDCEFENAKDKFYSCSVSVEPDDDYRLVLEGLETEVNYVEKTAKSSDNSRIILKPIDQVYVAGTDYVTNIQGSNFWTESISSSQSRLQNFGNDDQYAFKDTTPRNDIPPTFSEPMEIVRVYSQNEFDGNYERIAFTNAAYVENMYATYNKVGQNSLYINSFGGTLEVNGFDARYYPVAFKVQESTLNNADVGSMWNCSGINLMFFGRTLENGIILLHFLVDGVDDLAGQKTLTHVSGAANTQPVYTYEFIKFGQQSNIKYTRLFAADANGIRYIQESVVTDAEVSYNMLVGQVMPSEVKMINPSDPNDFINVVFRRISARRLYPYKAIDTLEETTSDDFVGQKELYPFVGAIPIGFPTGFNVILSDNSVGLDIGFGSFSESSHKNGLFFGDLGDFNYIPIGQQSWGFASLWYRSVLGTAFGDLSRAFLLRDGYSLHNVINACLKEIGSSVVFENTQNGSNFLYGSTPIGNVSGDIRFTPISNILQIDYTRAARNGKITLANIFLFLEARYNLRWFIEDGKLRIEHLFFFENGRDYLKSSMNKLNPIEHPRVFDDPTDYIKEKIVVKNKRLKRTYQDKVRDIFLGDDLIYDGDHLKESDKAEYNIDFYPDIFYALMNKNEVSSNSTAIYLHKNGVLVEKLMPYKGRNVSVINGDLSFFNIEEYLYLSHTDKVVFLGVEYDSKGLSKTLELSTKSVFSISKTNLHKLFKINDKFAIITSVKLSLYANGNEATFLTNE